MHQQQMRKGLGGGYGGYPSNNSNNNNNNSNNKNTNHNRPQPDSSIPDYNSYNYNGVTGQQGPMMEPMMSYHQQFRGGGDAEHSQQNHDSSVAGDNRFDPRFSDLMTGGATHATYYSQESQSQSQSTQYHSGGDSRHYQDQSRYQHRNDSQPTASVVDVDFNSQPMDSMYTQSQ
jgi:hypothetical protein